MTLGQRVRTRRKAADLTIEQLAHRSGVTLSTVRRVELDKHVPRIETLSKIAQALDCTVTDLLGEAA